METLKENETCYASPAQREVLTHLITYPDIEKNFFLTGGTALAVFYLHHRLSDDLDLFTKDFSSLAEIDQNSRLKDAIFDDPPTAAFQLETGIAFIKENPAIMPKVHQKIDMPDFYDFYEKVSQWLYKLLKNDL